MTNPILALLNHQDKSNLNTDLIKKIVLIAKYQRNPEQALLQLVQTNPEFKDIIPMLNSGRNPRDIFYTKAKESGINPDKILQIIQTFM